MDQKPFRALAVEFANGIFKVCHELENLKLHSISNQLIRCGTAIGAQVAEASEAESADDFIHKMKIAAKEAKESEYWLEISKTKVEVNAQVLEQLISMQKIITKSIQTATRNRDEKLLSKRRR